MSDSYEHGEPPIPIPSDPSGRVRVRKKVRVRTSEAQKHGWVRNRDQLLRSLLFICVGLGGLAMIWMGLRTFVREPGMP